MACMSGAKFGAEALSPDRAPCEGPRRSPAPSRERLIFRASSALFEGMATPEAKARPLRGQAEEARVEGPDREAAGHGSGAYGRPARDVARCRACSRDRRRATRSGRCLALAEPLASFRR